MRFPPILYVDFIESKKKKEITKARKDPSTIVPNYPRGIGFAFHRAGAAGENTKKR
jgi:hypothetical protein